MHNFVGRELICFPTKFQRSTRRSGNAENIIKCGIPQGSILGPLLFILYINDLSIALNLLRFILFADDTNVYYSGKNTSDVNNVLNQEMEKVSDWLIANQLSINLKIN